MKRALRVTRKAERQIRQAADWWHENRPIAPNLLHVELTRGFELITSQPNLGTLIPDPDLDGIRRLHLAKIRYHLYYRVIGDQAVEVLAFWHTSRGNAPPLTPLAET